MSIGTEQILRQSLVKRLLAQAACVRYACLRAPCLAWPLLLPSFSLSLLFFLFFCLFKFWPGSPAPQSRKAVSDWPLGGVQRDNPERPFGARLDLPQIFSAAGNSILNQSSLQDLNWLDQISIQVERAPCTAAAVGFKPLSPSSFFRLSPFSYC